MDALWYNAFWVSPRDSLLYITNYFLYPNLVLMPSVERALRLNKAYRAVVEEQNYVFGRDVNIKPSDNVHKEVEAEQSTGVKAFLYQY